MGGAHPVCGREAAQAAGRELVEGLHEGRVLGPLQAIQQGGGLMDKVRQRRGSIDPCRATAMEAVVVQEWLGHRGMPGGRALLNCDPTLPVAGVALERMHIVHTGSRKGKAKDHKVHHTQLAVTLG